MIQVELSPEVELRLQAYAHAHGVEMESYVKSLIENAVREAPSRPPRPRRSGTPRDMDAFFKGMAAYSDEIPVLPEEAFTRESFYQDHD